MNEEGLCFMLQVLLGIMKMLDSNGGQVTLNAQLDFFQKQCGSNLLFYHIENLLPVGKYQHTRA